MSCNSSTRTWPSLCQSRKFPFISTRIMANPCILQGAVMQSACIFSTVHTARVHVVPHGTQCKVQRPCGCHNWYKQLTSSEGGQEQCQCSTTFKTVSSLENDLSWKPAGLPFQDYPSGSGTETNRSIEHNRGFRNNPRHIQSWDLRQNTSWRKDNLINK